MPMVSPPGMPVVPPVLGAIGTPRLLEQPQRIRSILMEHKPMLSLLKVCSMNLEAKTTSGSKTASAKTGSLSGADNTG